MLALSLLIGEDFWLSLNFPEIALFSAHFSEGIRTLPSLRKEKQTQKSSLILGERQSIAQKGVRAIDARNSQLDNGSNATKTSVRAPGLSTDEREHPFV